jgi:hypothetical protein
VIIIWISERQASKLSKFLDIGPTLSQVNHEQKTAKEVHQVRQITKWSAEFFIHNNLLRGLFGFSNTHRHRLLHSSSSSFFNFFIGQGKRKYQIVLVSMYIFVKTKISIQGYKSMSTKPKILAWCSIL